MQWIWQATVFGGQGREGVEAGGERRWMAARGGEGSGSGSARVRCMGEREEWCAVEREEREDGHDMSSPSGSRRRGEGLPAMRLEVASATGEEDGGGLGWARVGAAAD